MRETTASSAHRTTEIIKKSGMHNFIMVASINRGSRPIGLTPAIPTSAPLRQTEEEPVPLKRRHSLAVRAVLLAVRETRMRRRVERETVEIRHVVGVDAIAELVIWRAAESGDQDTRYRPESDVDHVVTGPTAAERPAGVV